MKVNLRVIFMELAKRCKAGKPSDYQELWKTIHDLLHDLETNLLTTLREDIVKLTALELSNGSPRTKAKLRARIELLEKILGIKESKEKRLEVIIEWASDWKKGEIHKFKSTEELINYMKKTYDEWIIQFKEDGKIKLTAYDAPVE